MLAFRAILPLLLLFAGLAISTWHSATQTANENAIDWLHDLATSRQLSRDSGKPILLLNDSAEGRRVLDRCFTHPVIADATSDLLVPVIVSQKEPAGQVIAIVDAEGRALVPDLTGDVLPALLVSRLVAALRAAHRDVPAYLQLVNDEYNPANLQSETFAVGCYWEGEQQLGKLPGVVSTRTGMFGDDEVVQVDFDAGRIDSGMLLNRAKALKCFRAVQSGQAGMLQAADDQQHALAFYPEYRYLPLTLLQAIRVNAALADRADPVAFLSPSQRAMRDELHDIISRLGPDVLDDLQIDRSPDGLGKYAQSVLHTIAQLGSGPMLAGDRR